MTSDAAVADAADVTRGVPCLDGCPAGMECFSEGCLPVLPVGARCELRATPPALYPTPCERGASCVARGGEARCVPYGSLGAYCRYVSPRCDEGLACNSDTTTGTCVPGLPAGAFCLAATALCAEGFSCREVRGVNRCVPVGAQGGACRAAAGGTEPPAVCDRGLVCATAPAMWGWWPSCARPGAEGDTCEGPGETCAAGLTCVATGGRGPRRCARDGTPGARCVGEGASCASPGFCCDAGLTCRGGLLAFSTCVRVVPSDGACDGSGATTECATGTACTSADAFDPGRCVAPGTAAGADCGAGRVCVGALACSNFSRYRSTCRQLARVGDRCDLGGIQTLCPEGSRCLAAATLAAGVPEARCVVPTPERGANDEPSAPADAPTTSASYAGSIAPGDARDCYPVRVAAGASLQIEVAGQPSLPYDQLLLHVHDPARVEVARWIAQGRGDAGPLRAVARFTPEAAPVLRNLAAGTWSVCVTSRAPTAMESYTLSVSVFPAAP